jgi:hypothetical protein
MGYLQVELGLFPGELQTQVNFFGATQVSSNSLLVLPHVHLTLATFSMNEGALGAFGE